MPQTEYLISSLDLAIVIRSNPATACLKENAISKEIQRRRDELIVNLFFAKIKS